MTSMEIIDIISEHKERVNYVCLLWSIWYTNLDYTRKYDEFLIKDEFMYHLFGPITKYVYDNCYVPYKRLYCDGSGHISNKYFYGTFENKIHEVQLDKIKDISFFGLFKQRKKNNDDTFYVDRLLQYLSLSQKEIIDRVFSETESLWYIWYYGERLVIPKEYIAEEAIKYGH